MQFAVIRRHLGDKMYEPGDVREANEADVRHLIKSGVLVRKLQAQKVETKPAPKSERKGRK